VVFSLNRFIHECMPAPNKRRGNEGTGTRGRLDTTGRNFSNIIYLQTPRKRASGGRRERGRKKERGEGGEKKSTRSCRVGSHVINYILILTMPVDSKREWAKEKRRKGKREGIK